MIILKPGKLYRREHSAAKPQPTLFSRGSAEELRRGTFFDRLDTGSSVFQSFRASVIKKNASGSCVKLAEGAIGQSPILLNSDSKAI